MATNAVYVKNGTSFIWANSDYSPDTNDSLGTYSATYDIDLDGDNVTAGTARQSIKADLGNPRAALYAVTAAIELASDPAANGSIDFYWSYSESATAAVGNAGHATGADGAYAATAGYTLAELLRHLQFIGSMPAAVQEDGDGVQLAHVGIFMPLARYGSLIVYNNTSVAFHSDAAEMAVRFMPLFPDIQAAA